MHPSYPATAGTPFLRRAISVLLFIATVLAATAATPPVLQHVVRLSAASVSATDSLSFDFQVTGAEQTPMRVSFTFTDPTGFSIQLFQYFFGQGGKSTLGSDLPSGVYTLSAITVEFDSGQAFAYLRNGKVTDNYSNAISSHTIDFAGLDFALTGGVATLQMPNFATLIRKSADSIAAGSPLTLNFTFGSSTSDVVTAIFLYDDPNTQPLPFSESSPKNGVLNQSTRTDAISGKYTCTGITLLDSRGRRIDFYRKGTTYTLPAVGPATHAMDLSGLDFTITGGVEPVVLPGLTSVSRTSPTTILRGASATYTYALSTGTSSISSLKFVIYDQNHTDRSVTVANPPTSGDVSLAITSSLPVGLYSIDSIELRDSAGRYRIYSATGQILFPLWTSSPATHSFAFSALNFTVNAFVPPSISVQPSSRTVVAGSATTFEVTATGDGTLTYQWRKDGTTIAGAIAATFTIPKVQATDAGSYSVVVSNGTDSATSANASLSVSPSGPAGTPPTFVLQPTDAHPAVGGLATLQISVTTSNSSPVTFTASLAGKPLVPVDTKLTQVGDTIAATLSFGPFKAGDSGPFVITATNAFGATQSVTVNVVVLPSTETAPFFTSADSTIFTSEVPGTFQFTGGGNPLPTYSATSLPSWLSLNPVTGLLSGTPPPTAVSVTFNVTATSSVGAVTRSFSLQVRDPNLPVITSSATATFQYGVAGSFTVTATGTPAPTFSASGLPSWASLNSSTGVISGTPSGDAETRTIVITATNGRAANASQNLQLVVAQTSFGGTYFGTLNGDRGTWALLVKSDGTGIYLAYLKARGSAVAVPVTIAADGSFAASVTEAGPQSAQGISAFSTSETANRKTPAAATFVIGGRISGNSVTGTFNGVGESFSGSAETGGSSALAGYYTAPASSSNGSSYAIVAPSGRTFVLLASSTYVDATSAMIANSGELEGTGASGSKVSITINTSTQTMVAQSTAPGAPVFGSGARIVNLSVRTRAGVAEQTLIMGYVVTGSGTKQLLVRGLGPLLGDYGVQGSMADPELKVYKNGVQIDTNDNWGGAASLIQSFNSLGASPLKNESKDAALLRDTVDGVYSAHVSPKDNVPGIALAEIYDGDKKGARLVNVSARTEVGTGENILVAGFVLEGSGTETLLIRALGPRLGELGVTGTLANPMLRVFNSKGTEVASNRDWAGASAIKTAAGKVGASELPSGSSKDAAALVTLEPGVYSVQVSGEDNGSGVALVEIYEVPAN